MVGLLWTVSHCFVTALLCLAEIIHLRMSRSTLGAAKACGGTEETWHMNMNAYDEQELYMLAELYM